VPEDEDRDHVGETRLGMSCCRASCAWLNYREPAAAFDRFCFASMAAASHLDDA
jgi:hypothetical protein